MSNYCKKGRRDCVMPHGLCRLARPCLARLASISACLAAILCAMCRCEESGLNPN